MNKPATRIAIVALIFATMLALASCGGTTASQSAAGNPSATSSTSQSGAVDATTRAEIEQAFADVRANTYKNVTFSTESKTTATGTEDGKVVQQGVTTKMKGELKHGKKKDAMHINYEMTSTTQPEKVAYEMYIKGDEIIVKQDGKLYVVGEDSQKPEDYISAIEDIVSEERIAELLDIASSCKIERGEETTITITADPKKLSDTSFVDLSSLPEGTEMATLVANYVISNDNRLKSARIMSSTAGMPTYRVNQKYSLSKYGETKMPDWPTSKDMVMQDPRIKTDKDGTMYIIGDDGNKYVIESIDDDGTVHFYGNQGSEGDGSGGYYTDTTGGGYAYGGGGGGGNGGNGGRTSGGGGGNNGGGGTTGMGEPKISGGDDNGGGGKTGMGEPGIYEE